MDSTSHTKQHDEESQHGVIPVFIGADEIAKILGDTIISQNPPLTVGVFGKWNSGKSQLLNRTKERMEQKSGSSKDAKKLSVSIFTLLYRLIFFNPIVQNPRRNDDVSYVFVHFSILDYAGCDRMWAGVITHICKITDKVFGKWCVKLFRVWYFKRKYLDPFLDESPKKQTTKKRWKLSKTKILAPLLVLIIIACCIALWVIYGTPKLSDSEGASHTDVITIASTAALGAAAVVNSGSIFKVLSKVCSSQVKRISRLSKRNDFKKSLGFMDQVRTEIYYITGMLRYFGILLKSNLRICLIIDDVDLLSKDQMMDLLQVVSLLHSSPNSVYIQILCMDPMIAANMIRRALMREIYSDISGHSYLKKHIELPFYIPPICYRHSFCDISSGKVIKKEADLCQVKVSLPRNSNSLELQLIHSNEAANHTENELSWSTSTATLKEHLLYDYELARFIDGNERALKRVKISSQLALCMMATKLFQEPSQSEIKKLLAWITFVDQWPYRVSWIRQIVEDNLQLYLLEHHVVRLIADDARLEDVYHVVEAKLSKPKDWRNLLDLDSDPEAFKCFLQKFPFTVSDMKRYLPYTTNLNTALRRIIANTSAKNSVRHKSVINIDVNLPRWLQTIPLEMWTVEDVCFELKTMRLCKKNLKKYQGIAIEKKISGKILNESSVDELQSYFKMTPGDWNIFWMTIRSVRIFQSAEIEKV